MTRHHCTNYHFSERRRKHSKTTQYQYHQWYCLILQVVPREPNSKTNCVIVYKSFIHSTLFRTYFNAALMFSTTDLIILHFHNIGNCEKEQLANSFRFSSSTVKRTTPSNKSLAQMSRTRLVLDDLSVASVEQDNLWVTVNQFPVSSIFVRFWVV